MDLISFLKKNKDARKIFGKREIKIIEKQLLGIYLTQSEKNRLSRDVRKKFEIIEKLCRFTEEFKLKKGSKIKQTIQETKEIILEDELVKKIKKIILFGSVIEKTLTFRSDIDIAVQFDKITINEATKFRTRVSGKVPSRIDIQVYNHMPNKIKKQIDKKGKILYENNR
ncbi:hypothetical protein GF358_01410 [Candidatus Woesearchaeota archaeon]|nr:hypothetical protein [Candidatus Woesearchaeota archaeon]